MDCEAAEEAVVERHRQVLRSLSRRELQARAKELGVRANGKSVDIIESVAKVLSRPGSPVQSSDPDEVDDERENDNRHRNASPQEKMQSMTCGHDQTPAAMDCSDAAQQTSRPPSAALAVSGGREASRLQASPAPCTSTGAGASPSVAPVSTPGSFVTGSLAELAARASAATLAASMQNLRFESQRKAGALGAGPASLRRDSRQPLLRDTMRSSPESPMDRPAVLAEDQQQHSHLPGGEAAGAEDQVAAMDAHVLVEEEPARRLTFAFSPLPLNSNAHWGASPARRQEDASGSPVAFQARDLSSTPVLKPFNSVQTSCSDADRDGKAAGCPVSSATTASQSLLQRAGADRGSGGIQAEAAAAYAAQASGAPQLAFATAQGAAGAAATTPVVVQQAAAASTGPARPTGLFVTDRTPLRQQRLLGPQSLGAAAATPAGRGPMAPRTPGTGLRTPARRVPVCKDEAKEHAMDEWVAQHLVTPAGSLTTPAGLSWGELVGLQDAKERLQALCVNSAAVADIPSPSVSAPSRAAAVGGATSATSASKGSRAAAGSPAAGQARITRPSAGNVLPNAAVLVCGPPGVGKANLARALTSELGAAYLHVPPDLASRVAREPGGAEIVMRSVARVATQLGGTGPIVVHVEDVDQLVGVDATRQRQDRRRLRTELLVAVDELLLQPPGPTASPRQNGPVAPPLTARNASPASSSGGGASAAEACDSVYGGGKSRFKVLMLSTTSRPMDLDAALATSLGRTDRLLAGFPSAEDREMYLFGRLASEGAALGVEHLERLVRQTEGFSCAQLAALCDGAVKAAEVRRASGQAHGPVSLNEEDLGVSLQHMDPRSGADEMAELEQWMANAQSRRGLKCS